MNNMFTVISFNFQFAGPEISCYYNINNHEAHSEVGEGTWSYVTKLGALCKYNLALTDGCILSPPCLLTSEIPCC